MRVLIAGCGDVGTRLGRRLASAGHEVWGLRREAGRLPEEIRALPADLTDPASLGAVPPDTDAVVYAAAADAADEAAYRRAYVRGVRNLAGLFAGRGALPERLLFVSSTAVYGESGGEWVDEETPPRPPRFNGRIVLEGERAARAASARHATVVRFGGIYGPGRRRLIDRVREGAGCAPAPVQWTNRIHAEDCAGVLQHLLGLAEPAPLYVAVDDEPAPRREVMEWLAARMGLPCPPPEGAPGPRAPARAGREGRRCRNARLRASGYRFRYPTYREGYAALLAEAGLEARRS